MTFFSHPFLLTLLLFLIILHISDATMANNSAPVFGVWHIGVLGSYMEIVTEQLSQLQKAAFKTEFTFVRILSTNKTRTDVEYLIRSHPASEKLGTISFTYGDEKEGQELADTKSTWVVRKLSRYLVDDAMVWFIHNKGVSRAGTPLQDFVADWRQMMMYFLFEKDWCYRALKEDFYDTCGSNVEYNSVVRHYSGTFWMAHSRYIKTLPFASLFWENYHDPGRLERQAGEFWLLHSDLDSSRILCVHNSQKRHYHEFYPRSMYENAHIGEGCKEPVKPEFLASLGSDA